VRITIIATPYKTFKEKAGLMADLPVKEALPKDHFMEKDGVVYAGDHFLIDLWGASEIDDLKLMESSLRKCVDKAKATLLHIHLHHFTPTGGISGVAVLAESHISVHTWPEHGYAAFDIFMCGDSEPKKCIPILEDAFNPEKLEVSNHMRGKQV